MTVLLAWVTYSHDAHIWRLRLDQDGSPQKMVELPGFSGNLDRPEDLEKINLILATWGVYPSGGGWKSQNGDWVVPVIRRES